MGIKLIINNADFSSICIDRTMYGNFCYNITMQQYLGTQSIWKTQVFPYILANNSPYKGKELKGISLKVESVGKVSVYKCNGLPTAGTTTPVSRVKLFELTANTTGIVDLDFPFPVTFDNNEYFMLDAPAEGISMTARYQTTNLDEPYITYNSNGWSDVSSSSNLCIDFYY